MTHWNGKERRHTIDTSIGIEDRRDAGAAPDAGEGEIRVDHVELVKHLREEAFDCDLCKQAADYCDLLATQLAASEARVKEYDEAVGALTDAEDKLSCIPEGPERDELQRVYNDSDEQPEFIDCPIHGKMEGTICPRC